jgi:hypothetical protein
MNPSTLSTKSLPTVGAVSGQACELVAAPPDGVPLRVHARVRGDAAGCEAIFTLSKTPLTRAATDETVSTGFSVPRGEVETFYLAPGQTLYAAGTVDGVQVSFHVSEIRATLS